MDHPTLPPRIAAKIEPDDHGCWIWTAGRNHHGYGWAWTGQRMALAHRYIYELLIGPILKGLVLDHLCRVRHCVNPAHLRPMTSRQNTTAPGSLAPAAINAAQTHCLRDHPLSGDNVHVTRRGQRQCKSCRRQRRAVA